MDANRPTFLQGLSVDNENQCASRKTSILQCITDFKAASLHTKAKYRRFALEHLRQRDCCKLAKKNDDPDKCQCGLLVDQHQYLVDNLDSTVNKSKGPDGSEDKDKDGTVEKWTPTTHSRLRPTTAYGWIKFVGFGHVPNLAPYARVEHLTPPETLWNLLVNVWQLRPPKLVLSVTGGAQKFFMKRKLRTAFKHGLVDAAAGTDAWIITGGTCAGVMKYVGEALRDCKLSFEKENLIAIGTASWGIIDNREALVDETGCGSLPAVYNSMDCLNEDNHSAALDHNHTHFLLMDNGTKGSGIASRAQLESLIASKCPHCVQMQQSAVVLIMVEGGPNTVKQTARAIRMGIPAVIVKGTGRAADIIAQAHADIERRSGSIEQSSSDPMVSYIPPYVLARIRYSVETRDVCQYPDDIDITVDLIAEILRHKMLVTVFEMNDTSYLEMDKAILSALLKARKCVPRSQVELALMWNRVDVAREHIFTLDNKSAWQSLHLNSSMHRSLLQGRADFVQLFVDHGIHLGDFLSAKRLAALHASAIRSGPESRDDNTAGGLVLRQRVHELLPQSGWVRWLPSLPRISDLSRTRIDPELGSMPTLQQIGLLLAAALRGSGSAPRFKDVTVTESDAYWLINDDRWQSRGFEFEFNVAKHTSILIWDTHKYVLSTLSLPK